MIRVPWGGGPPLFTGIRSTLDVKLGGDQYRRLREASEDRDAYPALAPLFGSYLAWWRASTEMASSQTVGSAYDETGA